MTNNEFDAGVNKEIANMMGEGAKTLLQSQESLVEEAAMQYGRAVSDYESACLQRLPKSFYDQLQVNIADAMDNLLDAARQHFNDRFDGGAE